MAKYISVKAIVTVQLTVLGFFKNIGLSQGIDGMWDLFFGDALLLELVSSELESNVHSRDMDATIICAFVKDLLGTTIKKPQAHKKLNIMQKHEVDEVKYKARIKVDANFGELGAILVTNQHRKEMYLKDIVLDGLPQGPIKVHCESWIHSKYDNREKRVFFTNKSYLPSQTPTGLRSLRKSELENLRGNGQGERKAFDRVYDYDAYKDLGDPDSNPKLGRPVLGSMEHPYPRRCRTGRSHSRTDQLSESRANSFYVPRDEDFVDMKQITFSINVLDNVLHALIPSLEAVIGDTNLGFSNIKQIYDLFGKGICISDLKNNPAAMTKVWPNLLQVKSALCFPTPELIERDEFAWLTDEEFARETLAGLNPYSIKLVTEWPLRSKLDPQIYGPRESAITSEMIEQQIKGLMTVNEALEHKKLFILDYHDLLLPYVNKVRQVKGTTLYGSRTLFFLTPQGTLIPLAIELTRPPTDDGKPQWKQAFSPTSWNATESWLWKLAKAHVLAHDSGHHQLISHWLRTHCCVEPYIIATNRQLSAMHPIYKLMKPYFRYTMEINSLARHALINAGGIIETTFSTERYSMEFSSVVYDKEWRFDLQALPVDLISRGMAVEDSSAPHSLKLTIEDYPFANDGLLLWNVIKEWVTDYIESYYPNDELVETDEELQAWWAEIRNKGHQDKKDESWWLVLKTPDDLIAILTSMIWTTSGHHAAVNFGQYTYAGFFPNRPTIARIKMPSEDPTEEEWKNFLDSPLKVLLQTLPSRIGATKIVSVLNVLSNHSLDEEYIGDQIEPSWAEDPRIKAAFERFKGNLLKMGGIIDARNADVKLKNRNGAGIMPYQLLQPYSKAGLSTMGIPNSISI